MPTSAFNVVVMHGHGAAATAVSHIIENAGYTPRVLAEEAGGGTIFDRLRELVWDEIHCAVIVMTGDDLTADGQRRARQNVVFELGYCYGAFDSLDDSGDYTANDAIVVIEEDGVELFSDVAGLRTVRFAPGQVLEKTPVILKHLAHAYKCACKVYRELED